MRAQSLGLLLALLAPAHQGSTKRSIAVEVHGGSVHVLAHLEVNGKKQRSALLLIADENRDGRLSNTERKKLETKLALRALHGVKLLAGTATVSLGDVKAALKTEGAEPSAVMVLGQAPLSPKTERLTVVTEGAEGGLRLLVRPGARGVVRASRGTLRGGALTVEMGEFDRISWWLAPP